MTRVLSLCLLLLASAGFAAEAESPLLGTRIRSKKWSVRRAPHKVEEFSGDVEYSRGSRSGRSDWALYDHETKLMRARGDVTVRERLESGELVVARGEESLHEMGTERGWMTGTKRTGRVEISRTLPGRLQEDRGSALRAEWDWRTQVLWLLGDARMAGPEGRAWAERARYDAALRTLDLDGRRPILAPTETEWAAAVQADHIRAVRYPAPDGTWQGKVDGEGDARGWIFFKDRGKALGK